MTDALQPYMDLGEGKYNARDVLGMCRVYPMLAEMLEAVRAANVYEIDLQMAHLALQMTRAGLPVDLAERERVRESLTKLRDEAAAPLLEYSEGEHAAGFKMWVSTFQAATARKDDPKAGDPGEAGIPLSEELAAKHRARIRYEELEAEFAKRDEAIAQLPNEEDPKKRKTLRNKIEKAKINVGSKTHAAAMLRNAGVPIIKFSPKSKMPKLDKEVLEELSNHAAARNLLQYNLTSSVLNNAIHATIPDDDARIRPDWTIHKITGRWGSSPNVQNWSKRAGGGAENLRRMIAAPEGHKLVGADFAQVEARLIGAMSQEPFLVDTFKSGGDIHSTFAAVGFPREWPRLAEIYAAHKAEVGKCVCSDCKLRDKIRDLTKRLEYCALYGGSAETLWSSVVKEFTDLTLQDVKDFLATAEAKMPRVMQWRQQTLNETIQNNEIRSPLLGRRQTFPLGRVEPTVAYNFKAQSGGADLWALGALKFMQKWDQWEDDARLVQNGHDSILIVAKEEIADQVAKDVEECWSTTWNDVPFLMESAVGHRWSDT